MRPFLRQLPAALCVSTLAVTAAAAQNSGNFHPGDVNQSVPPPVSQKAQLPPLDLTDDQRAQVKHVLMTQNTEVTFQLKTTKPAKSFDPTVGAQDPEGAEGAFAAAATDL